MDQELEAARQVFTHEYREDEEKQTIEDRRWSYGSIQKAKVRTRHLQIHSVFHTCVPVPPHGRAGGLFRDFPFLTLCVAKGPCGVEPQHSQKERNK